MTLLAIATLSAFTIQTADIGQTTSVIPISTLEAFKSLCVPNQLDFKIAIRQADGFGWRQLPPRAMDDLPHTLSHMKDGQIRFTATGSGGGFLVFSGKDVPVGSHPDASRNRVCGIVGVKVGPADENFREDVAHWAGTAPVRSTVSAYTYVVKGNSSSLNPSQAQKDFDDGKRGGVFALQPPDANILVYLVPEKAN